VDFRFDEDQELLQTTVRNFLEKECTPELIRGLWERETARSPELWGKLAEIGVPGLLVPEEHGGMGMDELESVLLLEEAGRVALAEPVTATAVAVPLLRGLGGELAAGWLPKIAAGEALVAVGHPLQPFVEDAHVANLLLLPEGEDALHALRPEQVETTRQPANDPSRRIFSVTFTPAAESLVAEGERARTLLAAVLDRGALACAAQALGVCDRLITLAVAYASERVQFGKPIGSFQAVKHMLADVKVKLEYARPLVQRAAASVAGESPLRAVHVSMAKLAACEAASFAARRALQAHGAIGYTWEQDLHLWMRRAWSLDQAYGRAPFHLTRVREPLLGGELPIGPGTTFNSAGGA
jgi:alkylation response protein AidB-like acyl-CoA dehydrogenase